jgi:hypothetical protein|tara:strand:+ start:5272 stop:5826 length:555 start_codon:yes stop_codon:yes gene_type:complete
MKALTALLVSSAILLVGCNKEEEIKNDVVQAEPLKDVRDMNVKVPDKDITTTLTKTPPAPEDDVLLNTGVNFSARENIGGETHVIKHNGKDVTVVDTYFARDVWHNVYDKSTTPTEGVRKTICTQIIVNRESEFEELNGDIALYNMVCTNSQEQFEDHPSLKELRDINIEESVIESFNKWFSSN